MQNDDIVAVTGDDTLGENQEQRGSGPSPSDGQTPGPSGSQTNGDNKEEKLGEHHQKVSVPKKTQRELGVALNATRLDLKRGVEGLTAQFLEESDETQLKTKRLELETLISLYKSEKPDLDLTTMTPENAEGWKTQYQHVLDDEKRLKIFFDDAEAGAQMRMVKKELDQEKKHHTEAMKELQTRIDQLQANNERERRSAERRIHSLEYQLIQKQPDELSYDEVDMDEHEADQQQQIDQNSGQASVNLKLDAFQFPHFNGDLDDWQTWRDMFEYMVNKSKKMTKIMKFHQLISVVEGPALDCIRGYQVTEANYDNAWKDLKKRYDRTIELSDEYIRKFFDVPPIRHKATHLNIRAIIDVTNQMLRALPGLDVKVDNWDPILSFTIRSKLTEDLRFEWKQKQAKEKSTKIADLLNHLEDKAIELQPVTSEKKSEKNEKKGQSTSCDTRKHPKRIFQVSEQKPKKSANCPLCNALHEPSYCRTLKGKDAKSISKIVKKNNLCFKCMENHKVSECNKQNCNYCGKPHHPLLCFKKEADEKNQPKPVVQHVWENHTAADWAEHAEWNKPPASKN